jgi:hypothetical protein
MNPRIKNFGATLLLYVTKIGLLYQYLMILVFVDVTKLYCIPVGFVDVTRLYCIPDGFVDVTRLYCIPDGVCRCNIEPKAPLGARDDRANIRKQLLSV